MALGLASTAFSRGLRTLVVDLDPQSDVSTGMDIQPGRHLNVSDVLESPKERIVRAAIAESGWTKSVEGSTIDVMVGSPSAINFDGPHPTAKEIWRLEEALAVIEDDLPVRFVADQEDIVAVFDLLGGQDRGQTLERVR